MKVKMGLLVVLAILVAIFAILRLGVDRSAREKPLYPGFRRESAARITIVGKERETVIEKKEDGQWLVVSEDSFPAEGGVVEAMLDKITGFSRKDIISSNPEKQTLYQVDASGINVDIETTDDATAASFVIGKAGPDYQSTYVRDAGSDDVILAPGYLPQAFERGNRSWQDKTIYAFEPDDFLEIAIKRPGETIVLLKDRAGEWFISRPESTAVDPNAVSRLVRTLGRLRCDDFAGRTSLPEYGLAMADSSVWFRTAEGEHELVFGAAVGTDRIYTRTTASDVIYALASHKVGMLLPRLDKLRARIPDAPGEE
ncbi:MAG: DUF4340 domain-containing protein [Candidatus Eisenbacteria bacterium]